MPATAFTPGVGNRRRRRPLMALAMRAGGHFAVWVGVVLGVARLAIADDPFVLVLGIAQDGGFPQAGCRRDCCRDLEGRGMKPSGPTCLAVVDPDSGERWLIECTPAFPEQLALLDEVFPVRESPGRESPGLDGIFLTHAHIGHYAGLVHLGREAMGARGVPVHAMPRMGAFLRENGPWSQLVDLGNIELYPLAEGAPVRLNDRLSIVPLTVPHRDEFSETVAFRIEGPQRACLFLPDIDKWERWARPIEDVLATVDVAYLDATFHDGSELPGRDMSAIPHPFVVETIARFQPLDQAMRSRVRLIHLNHTNPVLDRESGAAAVVERAGLRVARISDREAL